MLNKIKIFSFNTYFIEFYYIHVLAVTGRSFAFFELLLLFIS